MMATIRERPKGVTAHLPPNGRGSVAAASGGSLALAGSPSMEGLTPLELMDAALAGCLVLSLKIAARTLGLADRMGAVAVSVTGTKANEAPSRIARQLCRFRIEGELSAAEKAALIAEAHRICTVGNSYAPSILIEDGDPLDAAPADG